MTIALFIILAITLIKYQPVYKVSIDGQEIGYIENKIDFEEKITQEVVSSTKSDAEFVTLTQTPSYEFKFASNVTTNDEEVLLKVEEACKPIYKLYSITLDGENKSYVDTLEEAEIVVNNMKQEYEQDLELNIGIAEVYTEDINEIGTVQLAQAETSIDSDLRQKKNEKEEREASTLNDVYFSVKPVSGHITSRFGSKESIRTSSHKGMDIASPNGTPIKAAADGTVKISAYGYNGGYGNYIVISHGNGVETYYGHCSRLYVSVGENITAGEKIGAVGSTGRSTGNHLHFEIRLYGSQVNPATYVYR